MAPLHEERHVELLEQFALGFGVFFPPPKDHGIAAVGTGKSLKLDKHFILAGEVRNHEVQATLLKLGGKHVHQAAVGKAVVSPFQSAVDEGNGVGFSTA